MRVDPKRASSELMNRAVRMANAIEAGQYDEWSYFKLMRKIDQMLAAPRDEPEALAAKALLQSAKNEPEAIDNFRVAVKSIPRDLVMRLNFITMLDRFGRKREALEEAKTCWGFCKGDKEVLDWLVRLNYQIGQFQDADLWLKQWAREFPSEEHHLAAHIEDGNLIAKCAPQADFSALDEYLHCALALAKEWGFSTTPGIPNIRKDDDSLWLIVPIGVATAEEDVADLNLELTERVAETDIIPRLAGRLVVVFSTLPEVAA